MLVTYDAGTNSIIKLHKALGDDARNLRYFETPSKSGYRLIADVQTAPPEAALRPAEPLPPGRRWSRWRLPIAGISVALLLTVLLLATGKPPDVQQDRRGAPTPVAPAIAVLPFDNLGAVPEHDYFADGITEDLITDLSKLSGLRVSPATPRSPARAVARTSWRSSASWAWTTCSRAVRPAKRSRSALSAPASMPRTCAEA